MHSIGGDEDDRDSGLSPEGSSDNDQDGHVEDMDMDMDGDLDNDGDGDGENEDEDNEDEDDEQDQEDSQYSFSYNRNHVKAPPTSHTVGLNTLSGPTQAPMGSGAPLLSAPTSHPNPAALLTNPSSSQNPATSTETATDGLKIRHEMLTAPVYDIVPTIAAPHSTSINSVIATPDLRWVFSGGADGYIRKFNWIETANGKAMLTVAQRHPFVDSVTKAGVLMSYWENEDSHAKPSPGDDGSSLSSVYSLAVHREGLWLLSGLESGGINLQSVRHDEGKLITCLRGHTSAVSVLNLSQDERSVLSGSWDKTVVDWDLNTGKIKRSFEGSGGQISALEIRPLSSIPVPEASGEVVYGNGTFSSDNSSKSRTNGVLINGAVADTQTGSQDPAEDAGSPADSLFGGNDSLFGDNDDGEVGAPSGGNFVDDDDDFSRAIAKGIPEQETEDAAGEANMLKTSEETAGASVNGILDLKQGSGSGVLNHSSGSRGPASASLANGLPHAEELPRNDTGANASTSGPPDATTTSDSTFLAASIDGSLRVWDKRQSAAIAKITPRNVPPWCMNACWSPDGNFIYAGRRNGTVEEFSLHKGLRGVERSLKLPNGSGAVSAVRAMPNGRHLVCASYDILRLYDLQQQQTFKHSAVPFLIVPGHRTGVVSQLYIDPTCRYMISTAGNRGWEGSSTEVLLGYEIGVGK